MAQPNILQVLKSVLAAFIGVQSNENRASDFADGKFSHYVIVGIAITIVFIFLLVFIVSKIVGS